MQICSVNAKLHIINVSSKTEDISIVDWRSSCQSYIRDHMLQVGLK